MDTVTKLAAQAVNTTQAEHGAGEKLLRTTQFFCEIGLPWRWSPGASAFLAGVDIVDGVLLIAPNAPVSNVLHEAGHLATLPGDFRRFAQSDFAGVQERMFECIDFSDPEAPLARIAIQSSDPEATAWAWAAGVHLGLAPEVIIRDQDYDGEGDSIRLCLQTGGYLGINGLATTGLCAVRDNEYARARGIPAFPGLKSWLQPSFGMTEEQLAPMHRAADERPRTRRRPA